MLIPPKPPRIRIKIPPALVFGPVGLDGVGSRGGIVSNAVEVETPEAVLQNQIFQSFFGASS